MRKIKQITRYFNEIITVFLIPLVSGCGGGGGSSSALGSLFSPSAGAGTGEGLHGIDLLPLVNNSGGESITLAHNPEPTSMFLIGGGMVALAYLRNNMKYRRNI